MASPKHELTLNHYSALCNHSMLKMVVTDCPVPYAVPDRIDSQVCQPDRLLQPTGPIYAAEILDELVCAMVVLGGDVTEELDGTPRVAVRVGLDAITYRGYSGHGYGLEVSISVDSRWTGNIRSLWLSSDPRSVRKSNTCLLVHTPSLASPMTLVLVPATPNFY